MVLRSSNDNRASAIFFDCPACRMVTLAFIWLTPSFDRTSYYTLLLQFNKMCLHFLALPIYIYFVKFSWEIVHLFGFHYKYTSRWTVLWMSKCDVCHLRHISHRIADYVSMRNYRQFQVFKAVTCQQAACITVRAPGKRKLCYHRCRQTYLLNFNPYRTNVENRVSS